MRRLDIVESSEQRVTNFNSNNGLRNVLNGSKKVGHFGGNARLRINIAGSPATSLASAGATISTQASRSTPTSGSGTANASKAFDKSVSGEEDPQEESDSNLVSSKNLDEKVSQALKSDSQYLELVASRQRLEQLSVTLRKDFEQLVETATAEVRGDNSSEKSFTDLATEFNELLEQEGMEDLAIETDAQSFLDSFTDYVGGAYGGDEIQTSPLEPILARVEGQIVSADLAAGGRASQIRSDLESQIAAPGIEGLAAGNGGLGATLAAGGPGSPLGSQLGGAIQNRTALGSSQQFEKIAALKNLTSQLQFKV